ncbi:hypothetical protein [Solirubrum puertoriconensis]|uniref:Uncharacterized protein n=1 Tax=Solirubrum puertoriconensis TaxID=1751427 RepID=A0A9X0L4A6_SOLP1|nr:hypothetical protein [Solirubrum puertoriconensis]KUG07405.1 hypothetical protein ASU33_13715 [Solirubrum puertoriconensis]
MFVKLSNGNLVHTSVIQRVERYTANVPDPSLPDTRTESEKHWGWDEDKRPKVNRPGIRVVMGENLVFSPYFNTEAEREAEMSRLESALLPATKAVFPNLAVRYESIQVVHFLWESKITDYVLKASIQTANAEPYVILVTEDLWPMAEALAQAFDLTIPQKPKTVSEMIRERYANKESDLPWDTNTEN